MRPVLPTKIIEFCMDYFFAIGKPKKSKYCVVKWSVFTDNLVFTATLTT